MLCDRVLGNLGSADPARYAGKQEDAVDVGWRDCLRRAIRTRSRRGRRLGILLPLGTTLRHGDVLFEDDAHFVTVRVRPCEVWVADFADGVSLATAALELGNLHVPVEVSAPFQLVTPPDGPARGVLDRHAAAWRQEVRRFTPARATVLGGNVKLSEGFRLVRADTAPGEAAAHRVS
jgi:urease accessory protein UreE